MDFSDIIEAVKTGTKKRIVVAGAQDADVLSAVYEAYREGLAQPVMVGDVKEIRRLAREENIDLGGMELIEAPDNQESVKTAVSMVKNGQAEVLMKGMLSTESLLRGVLNKEWGLATGALLSHVALCRSPYFDRMLFMSDAAMVMYPDLKAKIEILKNAVRVAHSLGLQTPKAACIAAVEVVNPAMPATLDAAALTLMGQRGQIGGCVIDGPLALDNALSEEAARHKHISSPVAGKADILLMPNIEAGNVFFKTSHYLGQCKMAGLIAGARVPIALTSRTDTPETKLNSIAVAILAAT
jgi:phosphate butyryltransferase